MISFVPKLTTVKVEKPITRTIESIYSFSYEYLSFETPVGIAIEKVIKSEYTGLPVLDNDRRPVGFMSEKTCLAVALKTRYLNEESGLITDYMSPFCYTMPYNKSIFEAAELFLTNPYHAYPVVNTKGVVVGVIRRTDILAEIARLSITSW